jgi:hypothetical protein
VGSIPTRASIVYSMFKQVAEQSKNSYTDFILEAAASTFHADTFCRDALREMGTTSAGGLDKAASSSSLSLVHAISGARILDD